MRGLSFVDRLQLAYKALTMMFGPETASAAYNLLGGIMVGNRGTSPVKGTHELLNTVNHSPWVRACAARVGDSMASVQWQLFVKKKGNGSASKYVNYLQKANFKERSRMLKELEITQELVEVPEHLLLDALRNGNPVLMGSEIRWLMSVWYDVIGDVFLIKQRNAFGKPLTLWPVPPHWVASTPTPTFPFYRMSWKAWVRQVPEAEVLWLHNPNAVDPYSRGMGLARALDDEISLDNYASKHAVAFFKNNARPDLLIMPKEGNAAFADADRDRFEEWWNERVGGFWRSFKPLFLKAAVEVKALEQNFQHVQLKELRDQERDTIIQVWGIPPEMFGIVSNSNRSTIDRAPGIFAANCLVPRLEKWREFFQERLVPEYDDRLILHYASPVPEDREVKMKVMAQMPPAFTLNEFRQLAGEAPDDTLDEMRFKPGTMSFWNPADPSGVEQAAELSEVMQPAADPNDPNAPNDDPNAEEDLSKLTDQEVRHLYRLVKKAKGPSTANGLVRRLEDQRVLA